MLRLQLKKRENWNRSREIFKINLGQEKNRKEETIQRSLEGRIKVTWWVWETKVKKYQHKTRIYISTQTKQSNQLTSQHQGFHLLREGIALVPHTSKLMLKILLARLQQYMNHELSDVQTGFRKPRRTRNQIANTCWINKKAIEFQKIISSSLLTMPKPLTVWITTNYRKFLKRWEY